jgi:hypothetical protein
MTAKKPSKIKYTVPEIGSRPAKYSRLVSPRSHSATPGFFVPFWALPDEFLAGFSAAAGIALINSLGNVGGFVGPYKIGAIAIRTGNLYAGLALAAIPLFMSATLVLLLRARSSPG